jgi:hypothetical protein
MYFELAGPTERIRSMGRNSRVVFALTLRKEQ